MNKSLLAIGAFIFSYNVIAQNIEDPNSNGNSIEPVNTTWKPSLTGDGVIDRVPHVNRHVEWAPIREIDVAWKRRIWRVIDVRQKQNQPFIYEGDEYSGGGAFIEILIDAVRKGKIAAYSAFDDRFATPLDMESFENAMGGEYDTVDVIDLETGEVTRKIEKSEFNVFSITKYRIKEDWIFDRNQGRLQVRIVGIAPIQDKLDEITGEVGYSTPLFWLYYPDLRKVLDNYEVYNPINDVNRITWTQFFDDRYFSSYVIKSSANNATGADLGKGLRALQLGQEEEEAIFNMSMDMWEQ